VESHSFSRAARLNGITRRSETAAARHGKELRRVIMDRSQKQFRLTSEGRCSTTAQGSAPPLREAGVRVAGDADGHFGTIKSHVYSIGLHELPPYIKIS
jgi:hypothetical protein